MCVNFGDEILLRGGKCKTWEKNSIFLKNGKTVISVEKRKFSKSWMTKRGCTVKFVSQNLVTKKSFV